MAQGRRKPDRYGQTAGERLTGMERMGRSELRQTILARRDRLPPAEQAGKSRDIVAKLFDMEEIGAAGHLFVYAGFRSEVQTGDFIDQCLAAGKTVSVPVTLVESSSLLAVRITDPKAQLRPGYCGIPEPPPSLAERNRVDPATIDVVIVPGSVFDSRGGRLGYGGGYYDRFLSGQAPGALRIALAYDLQVVDRVPMEPHDQRMDRVVTEKTIYRCRR